MVCWNTIHGKLTSMRQLRLPAKTISRIIHSQFLFFSVWQWNPILSGPFSRTTEDSTFWYTFIQSHNHQHLWFLPVSYVSPNAGFAMPPMVSRVMSRYRLPQDSVSLDSFSSLDLYSLPWTSPSTCSIWQTIPWHQQKSSLPGEKNSNSLLCKQRKFLTCYCIFVGKPPFAICPTHRTGQTSLGTPWDDGGLTRRSGATQYHYALP